MRWIVRWFVLAGPAVLAACGTVPPAAWERGDLARPAMAWDPDPLARSASEQVYGSKEAATGGGHAAGGGCGCR